MKKRTNKIQTTRSAPRRAGFTMTEFIVSCVVLTTVMTFVTSLTLRVDRIWIDVRHHRAAVQELSNQLDWLTRLGAADVKTELGDLQPSAECQRRLDQPLLSGSLKQDELGTRLDLELDWQRRYPGKPIQLSGWLIQSSDSRQTEVPQ